MFIVGDWVDTKITELQLSILIWFYSNEYKIYLIYNKFHKKYETILDPIFSYAIFWQNIGYDLKEHL